MKGIMTVFKQYIRTRYRPSFQSRTQLEAWQHKQVIKLLQYVLPRSPFYREYYQGLSLSEWRQFPLIHKKMMMEHFDELNTVGITQKEALQVALRAEETRDFTPMIRNITIGLSSGTSGHRGIFLVSEEERLRWAGAMLAKLLPASILSGHRVALFLRANSNLYTSVERGRIQFRYFDLVRPVREHIGSLNQFQPTILVAPPSMLRFLAEEQQAGRLSIQPQKVISVAEVLDPLDQQKIEQVFQQTVHQIYQCTEGFLATTCEYGTLHVNEDIVVIQKDVLDPVLGKFSPIITDFSRLTQPIIRYRLDDILTEKKEPCPCGSIFMAIEQIEGRCDDLFYLPSLSSRELVPVFPDFVRRAIISVDLPIEEYLVIQHLPDQLEISLKLKEGDVEEVKNAVLQSMRKLFHHLGCQMPSVQFTPYVREPSAVKLRRVERRFSL
ncbi:F390 synthetase-related protein [Thermoflavimicrobium dichotomicum]|uniref:Putative adenylate-forming enzyme n=1 Tax=Thermoflavimicrobium dichotomicum TaxID=46223 RepID=A0A1I3JQQ5_9BACL|nr:F390 synthetase-related protein [Thermoflavimicrobium dichotomicum]SFI62587.1 putative adenylate-forming enzyme [Thermoflavimicrobium dichotomicum]